MRIVIALLAAATLMTAAEPEKINVYDSGSGGYNTYRIPALLVTKKGTVLAFCEGRKASARDNGDIDLMLRRSVDGGRTWTPAMVVHEEGGDAPITIGNPSPVQDRKTGVIHLLFTRNNERLFITHSKDEGATWDAPTELTEVVRPVSYTWTRIATGPGHAIQLRTGRLLIPLWYNDRPHKDYRSAALYSDDHGRTWKPGGIVPGTLKNANECMFYERRDGTVAVNIRSAEHERAISISRDGGLSWSEPALIPALPDPICEASNLALDHGKQVLFANPAGGKRANLTLRLSRDGGNTWPAGKSLQPGPAAYSDLALARDGTVLCLYESGEKTSHDHIVLARIPRAWLNP